MGDPDPEPDGDGLRGSLLIHKTNADVLDKGEDGREQGIPNLRMGDGRGFCGCRERQEVLFVLLYLQLQIIITVQRTDQGIVKGALLQFPVQPDLVVENGAAA